MSIINEPKLQSKKQRAGDRLIISLGLALFSFFLLLLTLSLWGIAGTYFYSYLFSPGEIQATITMLTNLVILAVVVFIIMFAWSKYNLSVFGHLQRRRTPIPPTAEETGKLFFIHGGQVELAQSFQSATLDIIEERLVMCSYQGSCFSPSDPTKQTVNHSFHKNFER